jgi:hypothetical protein
MPNYVVLHHTAIETPHYDLLLDISELEPLPTWRLPHWPPQRGDVFTRLSPHRRIYLEYEGPISGDRGEVKRVATGRFEIIRQDESQLDIALAPIGELRLPLIS